MRVLIGLVLLSLSPMASGQSDNSKTGKKPTPTGIPSKFGQHDPMMAPYLSCYKSLIGKTFQPSAKYSRPMDLIILPAEWDSEAERHARTYKKSNEKIRDEGWEPHDEYYTVKPTIHLATKDKFFSFELPLDKIAPKQLDTSFESQAELQRLMQRGGDKTEDQSAPRYKGAYEIVLPRGSSPGVAYAEITVTKEGFVQVEVQDKKKEYTGYSPIYLNVENVQGYKEKKKEKLTGFEKANESHKVVESDPNRAMFVNHIADVINGDKINEELTPYKKHDQRIGDPDDGPHVRQSISEMAFKDENVKAFHKEQSKSKMDEKALAALGKVVKPYDEALDACLKLKGISGDEALKAAQAHFSNVIVGQRSSVGLAPQRGFSDDLRYKRINLGGGTSKSQGIGNK